MHAVFLHLLGDALGSVAVIIGALLNMLLPKCAWLVYVDPVISVLIALFIAYSSVPLVKSTAFILLQGVPHGIDIAAIQTRIKDVRGVLGVHDLHVWQLSDVKCVASVHVYVHVDLKSVGPDRESTTIIDEREQLISDYSFEAVCEEIRLILHEYGIHSTTIQPEFVTEGGEKCMMRCVDTSCEEKQCCN